MTQKPIDLLPESVRLRCQAGLRTGRYIGAVVAAIVVVVVTTTYARVDAERAQERLARARVTAELVLQTESRAAQLQAALDEAERRIELNERIALPIRMSSLLATLTNQLPKSVTLDRVDFSMARPTSRLLKVPSRSSDGSKRPSSDLPRPPRLLTGEITGFAASDEDIAVLIAALRDTPPLESISLDFSRTRMVRSQAAREFRMSFQIDLDSAVEEATARRQDAQGPQRKPSVPVAPQSTASAVGEAVVGVSDD